MEKVEVVSKAVKGSATERSRSGEDRKSVV